MVEERGIVKVIPLFPTRLTVEGVPPHKWVGRIITVELTTGLRIQGKILAITEAWIDTDNGAFKVEHVVSAKWVSDEEAQIIRGGPIGSYNPYTLPRR
jgi:hypothetical protein